MEKVKGTRFGVLGIVAVAVAIIAGLLVVVQVSAAAHAVSVGDGSATVDDEVTVQLEALEITAPGLGAWTLDITYDPSVVSVTDCAPQQGGVCNPEFGADMVRVTGASASGLEGDTVLADITFECGDAEGSSDLTLTVNVFADATIGGPLPIGAAVSNGSISCVTAPEPTGTPIIVNGHLPDEFGPVGSGPGSSDGTSLAWLVAALAAVGAGALGFGALRRAARRS